MLQNLGQMMGALWTFFFFFIGKTDSLDRMLFTRLQALQFCDANAILFFSPVEIFKRLDSAINLLALSPNFAVPINVISEPPVSWSNPCFPAGDERGQGGHRAQRSGGPWSASRTVCVCSCHGHRLGSPLVAGPWWPPRLCSPG